MSRTAAMGMPKLETGPQKSVDSLMRASAARRALAWSVERSLGLVRWAYGLSRHS